MTTLPDITVLGPYTYLATEAVFGSVALALLWYSGSIRRAGATIAALYPVAYVWDWYTLEVGVFAIQTRTGVDLLGIPIEEHIFIVVVPALVVGVHETLHGIVLADDAEAPADDDRANEGEAAATTDGGPAGHRADERTDD